MAQGWLQIAVFVAVLIALIKPVGIYMARVFTNQRVFLSPVVGPIERLTYRVLRVRPDAEGQDWKAYARSAIVFSLFSWVALYLILRTQGIQPFNPEGFHSGPWDVSFNTASSFVTNTNWQYYGGETTLTYFAQMAGLAVQNFVSAAVGIAVVVALIRGIVARSGRELGNFWQDLVRILLYVLLPISIVGALFLVSQGVIQNLSHATVVHTLTGGTQILGPGPGRLAGGDQGARHQRRRLLQRQLGLPVRERERPDQLLRDAADPDHPGQPHLHLRAHGRQPAPGLGDLLGDVRPLHRRRRRRLHGRAARHRRPARGRPPHPRLPRLDRRQHGGQGAALRGRRHLAVDGDHHGHLLRRGQRRLRVADRARPGGALRQPQLQRGGLRRRRHRPLLDAALRPARRLHRRPDGRPHPRVPRQEDPGAGDQAGLARRPGDAAGGPALLRASPRRPSSANARSTPGSTRRASRRPSTPTSRRPTTTAPRWPATPASSSPTRPATSAPTGSASPTCSAAW